MGPLLRRVLFAKRRRGLPFNGQNCSVLLIDVARFSSSARTDEDRRAIRQALYKILERSFQDSGIPWDACYREDRGDGVLIVIPPEVSTELLIDPLIDALVNALNRYNARAEAARSFQLRVGLHVGPVKSDPHGVNGEVIIHVSRLVEAPILKQYLNETGACLGFIASPFVYDSVIRQRPGQVDPAKYQQVTFPSKESEVTGWIYLGGVKAIDGHTP